MPSTSRVGIVPRPDRDQPGAFNACFWISREEPVYPHHLRPAHFGFAATGVERNMERTRSSKRRRLNSKEATPRSGSGSPDELSAIPSYQDRNKSNGHIITPEPRRTSYPNSMSDQDSPDELGNATPVYRQPKSEELDRTGSESRQLSSRSSTATPRPATPIPLLREAEYVPYREKLVMRGHRRGVASVRFSPDGRMVASCCE